MFKPKHKFNEYANFELVLIYDMFKPKTLFIDTNQGSI